MEIGKHLGNNTNPTNQSTILQKGSKNLKWDLIKQEIQNSKRYNFLYSEKIMSLSVPYHPYNCCLICGSSYAAEKIKKPVIEKDQKGKALERLLGWI